MKIVFKCDDLKELSPNVLKFDEIVNETGIKASWGVIGFSLEDAPQDYINWIKEKNTGGNYEFWNHGYTHDHNEFCVAETLSKQIAHIKKTQRLSKEKLGFPFTCFGAPCNSINKRTAVALMLFPTIKGWFYGKWAFNKYNFKRSVEIEFPFGNVVFEKFKQAFLKYGIDRSLITYQLHPDMWTDHHFEEFRKVIDFLKSQNAEFILPRDVYMK